MILLPVGLNSSVYKIPWVTVALLVSIVAISYIQFEKIDHLDKAFFRSKAQLQIIDSKVKLAIQLCRQKQIENEVVCRALDVVSQQPVYSLTEPMLIFKKMTPKKEYKRQDEKLLSQLLYDNKFLEQKSQHLKTSAEYGAWTAVTEQAKSERLSVIKQQQILAKGNISSTSLFMAQFTHGSYGHLIGNLLFFLGLSIFVELKFGMLRYSLLYFAGGAGGLLLELWRMPEYSIPLVGASANIAAVGGAFTYLFWKKNIKIFATLIFYSRSFYIPVYFFFPLFVVAGDVTGLLNTLQSHIAHLAHLGGFALGLLLAWIFAYQQALPQPFVFPEEYSRFKKLQHVSLKQRWLGYLDLIAINPDNAETHLQALKLIPAHTPWESLSKVQKFYLTTHLPSFLESIKNLNEQNQAVLKSLQTQWSLQALFSSTGADQLKKLYEQALTLESIELATLFYKALVELYPQLKQDANLVNPLNKLQSQHQVQGA